MTRGLSGVNPSGATSRRLYSFCPTIGDIFTLIATDPYVTPRLYRLELKGLRAADGRHLADGLVYLTVHWLAGHVTEPKSDW